MNQSISLEELIPNPTSLRLLILHTPFPLSLTPLQACDNLIKLDVSNNNLAAVPYLGHLNYLRFLFLHNNRLDFTDLRRVFSEEPDNPHLPQSSLAKFIVWVTFWGNKNCFYARHYLVNHTSVAAVDHHLVVEEEKTPGIQLMIEPFSAQTKIPFPMLKLQPRPEGFTQEQYIASFYVELLMLRKLHAQVNPVLTIQKMFRGCLVRLRKQRAEQAMNEATQRLQLIFTAWKKQAQNRKLLLKLAAKRNKQYLVGDLKLYKRQLINAKLVAIARSAKIRVRERESKRTFERHLKQALLSSHYSFQLLWEHVQFHRYGKLYILASQQQLFDKVIFPFASRGRKPIVAQAQRKVAALRTPVPAVSTIPYLNIMAPALRAKLTINHAREISKKRMLGGVKVRAVDRVCHLSKAEIRKSNQTFRKLCRFREEETKELLVVEERQEDLKAICRAVVLYNKGRLGVPPTQQIMVIPEKIVHESNAILTFQKIWKGYRTRKTHRKELLDLLCQTRAATRIQRWYRGLPFHHRRRFMVYSKAILRQFIDNRLAIHMGDYLTLDQKAAKQRMRFIEQFAQVRTDTKHCRVSLRWSNAVGGTPTICQSVSLNRRLGKPLFSKRFQQSIGEDQLSQVGNSVIGSIYSLLHVRTKTKILSLDSQQVVQVEYPSVKELRRRVFGVLLLTYHFRSREQDFKIVRPQTQVQQSTTSRCSQWKHTSVINNNSLFLFSESCKYFEERAQSLHIEIVRQPVLIYIKENRNSYPFRVQETIKFVHHTSIDLFESTSVQQPPTFVTETSREDAVLAAKRITITDLLAGGRFGRSEQELPAVGKLMCAADSKERAVSSHMTVSRNVDRLIRKRKPQRNQHQLKRTSIGEHLKTHYKTELSSDSIARHLQSDNRMLKTQTSQFESAPKATAQRPTKRIQEETFTSNFVSMSNFISKQTQINHYRQGRKRMHSQLASAVSQNRERAIKSRERMNQTLYNQTKKIREANREYKEELASKIKQINQRSPLDGAPRRKPPNMSKIHVVFPEECFPLEPT